MSNSDSLSTAYDADGEAGASERAAGSSEIKSLLDVIAAQLTDADRRHTAALDTMQQRLEGMGRETLALRDRVPGQFAPAFERIQAGLAEIADRLQDSAGTPSSPYVSFRSPEHRQDEAADEAADARTSDTPMPLRSAQHPNSASIARRSQEAARRSAHVDTFDVIESSLPGNVSDPWDHEAAEALAGLYETGGASFTANSYSDVPKGGDRHGSKSKISDAGATVALDRAWMDSRFSEIAKGIEQSLADIRPDHGFFALGQRLDQFEQQFGKMLEGVATQADVEAVRLIEAHVGEVVGQLMQAQDQLGRLGAIEDQLSLISNALADVQSAAIGGPAGEHAAVDFEAIARAAAEETAQRFAGMMPADTHAGADELRPLIERMMSESRQGEENTNTLLDTLQHAMIRLLDRVDAIETAQQQSVAPPAPHEYVREHVRFNVDAPRMPVSDDEDHAEALGAAVAAVASAKSMAPPRAQAQQAASEDAEPAPAPRRASEKSRQDFIAEARRAKMRLANADTAEEEVEIVTRPAPAAAAASARPDLRADIPALKPTLRATMSTVKPSGPSGPSTRLMVLAAVAVVALGGLWYSLDSDRSAPAPKPVAASTKALPQAKPAALAAPATAPAATPDVQQPTDEDAPSDAQPADPEKHGELDNPPSTIEGAIIPARVVDNATSLPMLGIAVDTERPATPADINEAQRHAAMATISGELGTAAAKSSAKLITAAALMPEGDSSSPIAKDVKFGDYSGMARSQPMDMPPATVGPLSLRLAAANGDPSAEFEVGSRLAAGKGTSQNFKDAAKRYQRAADHGSAQAQYRLGTLYERGLGLKADAARAADWYRRAAELGNVKSMHNLAVLSANQSGASPDYLTASQWFEKASAHGLADSQFNLAILYENGLGVKQDMRQAFMWLSLAANSGDKEAVRRRDVMQGKLTASDLAASQKMIASFRAEPLDKDANDARVAGDAWKKNPKNGVSG